MNTNDKRSISFGEFASQFMGVDSLTSKWVDHSTESDETKTTRDDIDMSHEDYSMIGREEGIE